MREFRDFIGNEYIRGFLQGAVRKGLDPHTIVQRAGLPAEAYEDPEAQINGMQLQSLIQAIKEATNDVYLGFLEYPTKLPMELEVTKVGARCETLSEALKTASLFVEYYRNDFTHGYKTTPQTREFCLGLNFKTVDGVDRHILHLYRLSGSYKFFSWLIGTRIKLTRVCFSEPKPEYCYDYRWLFHCDIQFEQPECQLCFDANYLNLPIVRTEEESFEYTNMEDWFSVPGHEHSLTSRIERILLELHKKNCFSPPIEVIAEDISVNPRTLRRMLARENESYQKIKTRVRCNLAIKLLQTTEIPVATIAERVGFVEPGDFTRAFAKWTGTTPSEYRAVYAGTQKNGNHG